MIQTAIKIIIACLVWGGSLLQKKGKDAVKNFCTGFCVAEACAGLCGRCAWTYSVVFGEMLGFVMLAVTVVGAMALFGLLSGNHSSLLLTALYIFFFTAESEYVSLEAPIINSAAKGLRLGCVGMKEIQGKKWLILLGSALGGSMIGLYGTQMPAAFAAISCCALLTCGIKNISCDRWCCIGAVSACLLAYL